MSREKKGYLKSLANPSQDDLADPLFVKRRAALRKMGFLAAYAVPAIVVMGGTAASARIAHRRSHDEEEEEGIHIPEEEEHEEHGVLES